MWSSVMKANRFAAIDLGTVTCRLLVADVVDGSLVEQLRRVEITNLGQDVDKTGVLRADAIERVSSTIAEYRRDIDALQSGSEREIPVTALATSASRDAENSQDLIEELAKSRVSLCVIPGEREAALSFKGASSAYAGERLLVVDVGGGSTELVFGIGGDDPVFRHSFDIGCRRVTERFLPSDPPSAGELNRAAAWIREMMQPVIVRALDEGCACDRVVAVAGTATSMVSIDSKMAVYDPACVDGSFVSAATLKRIYAELAQMPLSERECVVGLEPKRAPVIVAGALILQIVLDLVGASGFTVSESDILQGIIMDAAGL